MKTKFHLTLIFVFSFSILFGQFGGKPKYTILTTQNNDTLGIITIELFPTIAPLHVANFDSIVNAPISFDNRAFHRIIKDFMIQGGDPNSISGPESTWGFGDPSQANVNAEFNPISHTRGTLSAARSANINSASSQFFICDGNPTHLDGDYTAYGKVVTGMNIVDTIANMPKNSDDLPNDKISMFIDFLKVDSTEPAQAPTLDLPVNYTRVYAFGSTEISWNKVSTTDFLTYKIQVSQQEDFSTLNYEKDVSINDSKFNLPGLLTSEITYYWRVCSNNGGNLTCSESRVITSSVNGVNESQKHNFIAYPNPSNGIVNFTSLNNSKIRNIKIFNSQGSKVIQTSNNEVNLSDCPKGIYFYKVNSETGKIILK